ncbi:MAG: helix-turn-helix domain-containing protein [Oscillospiraceae bacterium]|jgi:repressor LexA|nr:helix-turn-helix domain-containing protein [Oscillospiraceae bacterium]
MFGLKLKSARKQANLRQAQLAKMLDVSGNAISNWENGVSKPDILTLEKICEILNVSPNYFFEVTKKYTELKIEELSDEEIKLIEAYRELSSDGKDYVTQTMAMAKRHFKRPSYFSNN